MTLGLFWSRVNFTGDSGNDYRYGKYSCRRNRKLGNDSGFILVAESCAQQRNGNQQSTSHQGKVQGRDQGQMGFGVCAPSRYHSYNITFFFSNPDLQCFNMQNWLFLLVSLFISHSYFFCLDSDFQNLFFVLESQLEVLHLVFHLLLLVFHLLLRKNAFLIRNQLQT